MGTSTGRWATAFFSAFFATLFAGLAALVWSSPAAAQLSSEQQSGLRSNCRGDFMSKCSGVKPGGQEALTCLQKNVNGLSAACKAVVVTTMPPPPAAAPAPARATAAPPPPAAAAPPPPAPPKTTATKPPAKPVKPAKPVAAPPATPTAAQQSAMRSACRSDFMSHCAGVSPGGKDALACLQRNVAALSPGCKNVVGSTMAAPRAPAAAAVAPAAVPPPADAVAVGPTPEQMSALKFTCRGDFGRLCKGIPPGPQAFACLQAHQARLSQNCRTSVAAIAAEMPADGMPAAAPVAVPPPPVVVEPGPVDIVVMLRACKRDLIRHCRGVKPGGGRELACLNAHAARLTVRCRMARKVTAPLRR
jgi:hypothetical protein